MRWPAPGRESSFPDWGEPPVRWPFRQQETKPGRGSRWSGSPRSALGIKTLPHFVFYRPSKLGLPPHHVRVPS